MTIAYVSVGIFLVIVIGLIILELRAQREIEKLYRQYDWLRKD